MSVDLGAGLFAWAKTIPALTALIGDGVSSECRFFPISVQSAKTPPIIYYDENEHEQVITQDAPATTSSPTVIFSCVDVSASKAEALGALLKANLLAVRYTGALGSVTVLGIYFESATRAYQWSEQQFAMDLTFRIFHRD